MRDKSIDFAKGICILAMILGHGLYDNPLFSGSPIAQAIYNIIYSFHMPMLFCISGYLTKPISGLSEKVKAFKKVLYTYYVEYLIIVFLCAGIIWVCDGISYFSFGLFIKPISSAWFLLSLFLLKGIWVFIGDWIDAPFLLLLSIFVFYNALKIGVSYSYPVLFLPCFAVGFYLRNIEIKNKQPTIIAVSCILIIFLVEILLYRCGANIYEKNVIGTAFFVLFLMVKPFLTKERLVSFIGQNSIVFYAINTLIGRIIVKIIVPVSNSYLLWLLIYIFSNMLFAIIVILIQRNKYMNGIDYLFNPYKFVRAIKRDK